jgi:voltage-gated potassium channel
MKSNINLVSFQALLISLVLLLFVPTLATTEWLTTVSRLLFSLTMASCLYLAALNRTELIIGTIIFVPTILTKWMLAPVLSADTQLLSYCVLQVIFLCYIMRLVYLRLLSVRTVNQEVIYASIVLYLLFGICLTLIYYAILILEPSAFGGKIVLDTSDALSVSEVLQDLIYFSLVTQTTLGYGDLSPTLDSARIIATFQAILGQLYIAVVVARLVGIAIATADNKE